MELLHISNKISLTPSPRTVRLNHLKQHKTLWKVIPIFDHSLLGFNTHRLSLTLAKHSERVKFISYLHTKKEVTKIYELLGKHDLDIELEFKTTLELDNFLEKLRLDLPNIK